MTKKQKDWAKIARIVLYLFIIGVIICTTLILVKAFEKTPSETSKYSTKEDFTKDVEINDYIESASIEKNLYGYYVMTYNTFDTQKDSNNDGLNDFTGKPIIDNSLTSEYIDEDEVIKVLDEHVMYIAYTGSNELEKSDIDLEVQNLETELLNYYKVFSDYISDGEINDYEFNELNKIWANEVTRTYYEMLNKEKFLNGTIVVYHNGIDLYVRIITSGFDDWNSIYTYNEVDYEVLNNYLNDAKNYINDNSELDLKILFAAQLLQDDY